ncbi:MAG: hypothetical protein ACOC3C_04780 [Candidatus Thorarchaeota archaeon]
MQERTIKTFDVSDGNWPESLNKAGCKRLIHDREIESGMTPEIMSVILNLPKSVQDVTVVRDKDLGKWYLYY